MISGRTSIMIIAVLCAIALGTISIASEESDAALNVGMYTFNGLSGEDNPNESSETNAYYGLSGSAQTSAEIPIEHTFYILIGGEVNVDFPGSTVQFNEDGDSGLGVSGTRLSGTVLGPEALVYITFSDHNLHILTIIGVPDTTTYIDDLTVSMSPANPQVGDTITLTAEYTPSNPTYAPTLVWMNSSSDEPINQISVSSNTLTSVWQATGAGDVMIIVRDARDLGPDHRIQKVINFTISESGYTYTVSFDLRGGTSGPDDMSYGPTTDTSHTFTVPDTEPTREGWTFLYWGTSTDGTVYNPGDTITVTSEDPDVTLVAAWAQKTYTFTITFDDNGGTGGPDDLSFGPTVSTAHTFEIPETEPTRPGFTFQYWDSDVNERHVYPGGDLTVASDNPDVTLTAVWEEITYTYTVTFDDNGGTGGPDNLSYGPTPSISHVFVIPDDAPELSGSVFDGWMSSGLDPQIYQPGDDITVTSEEPGVTLTAVWADAVGGVYISISGTTSATVGDTRTITAVVLPSDTEDKSVTWTVTAGGSLIDYETAATWRGGTLTYEAQAAGTVTIQVTSVSDPNAKDLITITISAASSGDSEVIGPGGITQIVGNVLFDGNAGIAGVVLFAIILGILFTIIREPLPVVLLGIPIMGVFTLLGLLDMNMVILLIIVTAVGLALIARNMWRD